jgi:hypothetical protein
MKGQNGRVRKSPHQAAVVKEAIIDRRVQVTGENGRKETTRVSELRSVPYLVLLGEPGMGKSTVLRLEAEHEHARVLKVRQLITGSRRVEQNSTLFIDSFDEYRSDGSARDKACFLAKAIIDAKAERWRLCCRSHDWREQTDVEELEGTTGGVKITVARLLPISRDEGAAILAAFGETDPSGFLRKAEQIGASAFAQNPHSLHLLREAVADGGAWPGTRFELFERAIEKLAHERNRDYELVPRSRPDEIIDAAAVACLLLLVTGAPALWRSNAPPPKPSGDRPLLTAHDLKLDDQLVSDMLDTALFRGEENQFEPMHRTVAEFLAGQALAHAVTRKIGEDGKAALPRHVPSRL